MECKFQQYKAKKSELIAIAGKEVAQMDRIRFLESIAYNNREIEEDVTNTIKAGWLK